MSLQEIITALDTLTVNEKLALKEKIELDLSSSVDSPKNDKKQKKIYRRAGWAKGKLISISKDFDEPLEDMKEYMY